MDAAPVAYIVKLRFVTSLASQVQFSKHIVRQVLGHTETLLRAQSSGLALHEALLVVFRVLFRPITLAESRLGVLALGLQTAEQTIIVQHIACVLLNSVVHVTHVGKCVTQNAHFLSFQMLDFEI